MRFTHFRQSLVSADKSDLATDGLCDSETTHTKANKGLHSMVLITYREGNIAYEAAIGPVYCSWLDIIRLNNIPFKPRHYIDNRILPHIPSHGTTVMPPSAVTPAGYPLASDY